MEKVIFNTIAQVYNPEEFIPRKTQDGVSIINENPIGILEKIGKYEFIYDYKLPRKLDFLTNDIIQPLGEMYKGDVKMIAQKNIWSGQSYPQAVRGNSQPEVGIFSKGNIVNVLRFDGNNAIIQNPNYVELEPNSPKLSFFGFLDLKNQKEFSIPKNYLRKADDTLAVTVSTGINYGLNFQQPIIKINKPIPNDYKNSIIEENATFILNTDFQYISSYNDGLKSQTNTLTVLKPNISILKSGTKVSGRLFRQQNNLNNYFGNQIMPKKLFNEFLAVKGYGVEGSINIPIEYLTRLQISNPLITDNNSVVSVISLVDKTAGRCNESAILQQLEYNPCRVSAVKGQTYKGYISGDSFYSIDNQTFLNKNEFKLIQQNGESIFPTQKNNNNLLLIVGAFILGLLLTKD